MKKFRGWYENKMYQNIAVIDGMMSIEENPDTTDYVTVVRGERTKKYYLDWVKRRCKKDAIVMQFTGLKDKNNTDIYEGDILKVKDTSSFVVYWETSAGFRFNSYMEIDDLYAASKVGEVIGNIYENSDFL